MSNQYIEIDLTASEKQLILRLASFFIMDKITEDDLKNKRKKWIRFEAHTISDVAGELSHHCNRCKNLQDAHILDELINHLEFYEKRHAAQ